MKRIAVACILPALTLAASVAAQEPTLDEVLAGFDRVQLSIQTLSAEFSEATESPLLTEGIVASGRVYLTKPHSVRWEYSSPEEMRFVISENQYTGYFPKRKKAERRDIQRWREQLFRFLGLGQASEELAKFYKIELGPPQPDLPETYLLRLEPRKKRVRKRMEAVRFWIDRESYLPVRIEYSSKQGNRRVIEFTTMKVNPRLAASLYTVDLPADVQVSRGFSALSGLSGSASH